MGQQANQPDPFPHRYIPAQVQGGIGTPPMSRFGGRFGTGLDSPDLKTQEKIMSDASGARGAGGSTKAYRAAAEARALALLAKGQRAANRAGRATR